MARIDLRREDTTHLITVHAGDTVRLILPDNPTTGYRWMIQPGAESIFPEVEEEFVGATEPNTVGAAGHRHFEFRQARKGQATLVIILMRPWLGPSSGVDQVKFTVRVDQ